MYLEWLSKGWLKCSGLCQPGNGNKAEGSEYILMTLLKRDLMEMTNGAK